MIQFLQNKQLAWNWDKLKPIWINNKPEIETNWDRLYINRYLRLLIGIQKYIRSNSTNVGRRLLNICCLEMKNTAEWS